LLLSELFAPSLREDEVEVEVTHLLEQPEGRKTAGASLGVDEEDRGWRRSESGRRSEGRLSLPLSSILDKNKVNGEWGCRRGGCCSTGVNGRDGQGELLRDAGNDAPQAGTYQNERGKAKSTAIDATGHAKYKKPLLLSISHFTSFSR